MGVKHEGISTRTGLEIILKEWKNTRKHQPTIKQLIYHFDRHKFRDFARLLRQTFLPGVNKEGEQSTKIIRQNPADFLKTMKLAIIESCVCTQTLLDALKDIINEDDKQKIVRPFCLTTLHFIKTLQGGTDHFYLDDFLHRSKPQIE